MRAPQFLVQWFSLLRLKMELVDLQKKVAKQLAEMDRTHAAMRDMKCPHCGKGKTCE